MIYFGLGFKTNKYIEYFYLLFCHLNFSENLKLLTNHAFHLQILYFHIYLIIKNKI